MGLVMHVDGGSRGNPGPAGAGVVISDDAGTRLHEGAYFLGNQTNNSAEYQALIRGLRRAESLAGRPLHIHSDSELLVRQLIGEYRVKSEALAGLFAQAQTLLLRFGGWQIRHVPRAQNRRADELANIAMDRRRDVIVFDIDAPGEEAANGPNAGGTAGANAGRTPTTGARRSADPVDESGADSGAAAPEATGCRHSPGNSPGNTSGSAASGAAASGIGVRIAPAAAPTVSGCPAGAWLDGAITVRSSLPVGMCVYAAHTLVPTILAVQNTESDELSSVPTLTLRCGRAGCGAKFLVSPACGDNGNSKH